MTADTTRPAGEYDNLVWVQYYVDNRLVWALMHVDQWTALRIRWDREYGSLGGRTTEGK